MRSSNEEVMRNLEDRRNRLAIECDKAHRAWRDSYDANAERDKGYDFSESSENLFEAWTAAIEELNETEQALILMERIIKKEEARKEPVKEVTNLKDVKPGEWFIVFHESDSDGPAQWGTETYEMIQKVDRIGDHFFILRNVGRDNQFPSYLDPLTPTHIVPKDAE